MPEQTPKLRPEPAERFAGAEHLIDLGSAVAALRTERHPSKDGHRQITLFRKGSLRLVLFAFEPGGRLAAHRAPGFVVIRALRGTVLVRTDSETHKLVEGRMLLLDPDVTHDVEAVGEADMLLTISMPPTIE